MAYSNVSAPHVSSIASYSIVRTTVELLNSANRWNRSRMTQKRLEKLSDRQLNDVGLTRADIMSISRL